MLLVIRIPKAVMYTIQANVHVMKVVPWLGCKQMTNNFPMLAAHGEDLFPQPGFIICAKTSHIGGIVTDQFRDFFFDLGRMGKFVCLSVWGQKTSHADAVNFSRRITRR